jgi:ArsR family transcriptional regulator, arsenate/arsenite/antimonite-responsive transcriptional repressor
MEKPNLKRYEARARIVKALAHPTRLFIVDKLAEHEYCVNELTAMVGCDMSTMSKHLSILRNAGVVVDEKRGACIYYTLRCPCIVSFFTCTDKVLATVREEQAVLS